MLTFLRGPLLIAVLLLLVPGAFGQHNVSLDAFGMTYSYPEEWDLDRASMYSTPDIRTMNAFGSTFHHFSYVSEIDSTLYINPDGTVDYEGVAADSSIAPHFFIVHIWPDANWFQQMRWNMGMMRNRGGVFNKNIVLKEELEEDFYFFGEGVAYHIATQVDREEIPPHHHLVYRFVKNGHLYQLVIGGGYKAGFDASLPIYADILKSIRFHPLPPVEPTSP